MVIHTNNINLPSLAVLMSYVRMQNDSLSIRQRATSYEFILELTFSYLYHNICIAISYKTFMNDFAKSLFVYIITNQQSHPGQHHTSLFIVYYCILIFFFISSSCKTKLRTPTKRMTTIDDSAERNERQKAKKKYFCIQL